MKNKHKIYLGLTTTGQSSWREKIEEIKKFKIEEIALFPTCLEKNERHELYKALDKTRVKYVPFLHLRHDSTDDEIDFFKTKYKTRLFNIHPTPEAIRHYKNLPEAKKIIFIENTDTLNEIFYQSLKDFAGICFDPSHWEDYGKRQKSPSYRNFARALKENPIGFAHLTSIQEKPLYRDYGRFSQFKFHHCAHYMEKITDYDYLKKYRKFLPEVLGIETENTLTEQLEIKKYLEKIL